jgi:toxin CcdB
MMARFDVYRNPDKSEQAKVPFYLDVQNTFVDIDTRAVVPLVEAHYLRVVTGELNPLLKVRGEACIMNTSAIGVVPTSFLRRPVGNVADQQVAIQQALDTLLGSY